MIGKIQKTSTWIYLYSPDNKILKSAKLPMSGDTTIAETRLRVWAKHNGVKVAK